MIGRGWRWAEKDGEVGEGMLGPAHGCTRYYAGECFPAEFVIVCCAYR